MNWMRRNVQPRLRAIALASMVLPMPGTSSIRRWPRHSRATRARRTSWCLPDDDALDVGEDLVPDLLDVAHRTPVVVRLAAGCVADPEIDARDRSMGDVARESGSSGRRDVGAARPSVRPERAVGSRRLLVWALAGPKTFNLRVSGHAARPVSAAADQRQPADPDAPSGSRSPPMTPRNGSPPTNAATDMKANSAASTRAITASPMRSMIGRGVAGATARPGSAERRGRGGGVASSGSGSVIGPSVAPREAQGFPYSSK